MVTHMGLFNSLVPGRFQRNFHINNVLANFAGWLRYLFWNCPPMNVTVPYWWWVDISSGNGLLPSANVDPDLCHHMASLGHNELILTIQVVLQSYIARTNHFVAPVAPFGNMDISIIKCGKELLIHSQTSIVPLLKFGNWNLFHPTP